MPGPNSGRLESVIMRWFLGVTLAVMCNLTAFAQNAPKAEIFGGFSYANYELLPAAASFSNSNETISGNPSGRLGLLGWNGSAAVDMNRWFSFATDFSGYYSGSSVSTTTTVTFTNTCVPLSCPPETDTTTNTVSRPRIHNFLFGPQLSYPTGKIRPFAHFLIGGQRSDVTRSEAITSSSGVGIGTLINPLIESSFGFGTAIGGGADYTLKRNLAWRVVADYLTNQGTGQNHVRVSTGLVWRLGS